MQKVVSAGTMAENDRRIHIRTAMSAKVKVTHESLGEFVFATRDISDGGVFIVVDTEPFEPTIGDKIQVQVQGLPIPAPVLEMVVVRKTVDGFGLQFADE
jgi:phosphatidate phosphatase APP1